MKSKISYFNKGIIISNLKRYGWICVLWSVLLFLSVPFRIINFDITGLISSDNIFMRDNMDLFIYNFGAAFSNLMLCGFPVLTAVMCFSYLHSPNASTLFHGLPLSRGRLFASALLSSFIIMVIPFILNTAIVLIIKLILPIGKYIYYITIVKWLLSSLCLGFVVLALAVFTSMFTGNIIAALVFPYIIHFLPLALFSGICSFFQNLIYGYSMPDVPLSLMRFPMMSIYSDFFAWCYIYAIAGVILLAAAVFVYKKRPVESAGEIVSFKFIRPVFKYGATFCTALFGYLFIAQITSRQQSVLIAILFALIGYLLSQMLLSKTWHIQKYYKGFLASAAIILCVWGALSFDVFGIEKYIPKTKNISSVEFSLPETASRGYIESDDEQIIELISQLHSNFIYNNSRRTDKNAMKTINYMDIIYHTKSGKIHRSYEYYKVDFSDDLSALYSDENILKQAFPILNGTQKLNSISIDFYDDNLSYSCECKTKDDLDAVSQALRRDLLSLSPNQFVSDTETMGWIYAECIATDDTADLHYYVSDYDRQYFNGYNYYITRDFKNVLSWIEEHPEKNTLGIDYDISE